MKVYVLRCAYSYEEGFTIGAYSSEGLAEAAWTAWHATPEGRACSCGDMEITPCVLDDPAAR